MFRVQQKQCATCIYRDDNPLDLEYLENQVRDSYGFYSSHKTCHHSEDVCCRGFWDRHKDEFQTGQIAQRLGFVEFVNVDTLSGDEYMSNDPRIYYRCSKCGKEDTYMEERYSMGIYAGRYCSEKCWKKSGYRDVGPEEFDPDYAGERLDDDY